MNTRPRLTPRPSGPPDLERIWAQAFEMWRRDREQKKRAIDAMWLAGGAQPRKEAAK